MATVLVGIDEAGYGPTLGPLCVAMAAFRVPDEPAAAPSATASPSAAASPAPPPDLWKILDTGVAREPGRGGKRDARGRVAVADSKHLKLSNSVTTTHPLIHLERGVLSFLRHRTSTDWASPTPTSPSASGAAPDPNQPATDAALFDALCVSPDCEKPTPLTDADLDSADRAGAPQRGTALALRAFAGAHRCYTGEPTPLPVASTAGELAICGNVVGRALAAAGVEVVDLACVVIPEGWFNARLDEGLNKAEVSGMGVGVLLRRALARTTGLGRVGVVCDRQGGRMTYGPWLSRQVPGAGVEIVGEDDARSRYLLTRADLGAQGRAGVSFLIEAEQHHMAVALASMTAKFVRELAMARFNAYWSARARAASPSFDLAPTAGYATDARRWLSDAAPLLTRADRDALVRRA
jgi:hypothetical protein